VRRPQALIVPPRVKVPRTWLVLLVAGWSQVSLYLGTGLTTGPRSTAVVQVAGPGRPDGQVGCRNGNASLYYKSRPEGTWGSHHDTSPTRLTVSVPSDAGLRSKASEVRSSHRCHGTARCTAASYKVHPSRPSIPASCSTCTASLMCIATCSTCTAP
jgi:hypothetical protein